MATTSLLVIDADGDIQTLYNDSLQNLGEVVAVARASNVEPGPGGWDVVLTDEPRNGEFIGTVVGLGYKTRQAALDAEVDFINANILGDLA